MKQIVNILKRELVKQYDAIFSQNQRVSVAQEAFFSDPTDQHMFTLWSNAVQTLASIQTGFNDLLGAYKSMCQVAGIPQVSLQEMVEEKKAKDQKRADRKAAKLEKQEKQPKQPKTKKVKEEKKSAEPKAE